MPDPATSEPTAAEPRTFRLKGEVGGVELALPLMPGVSSVGSDPASQVVLDQAGVSRFHAALVVEPGRVVVADQDSKNGTFVGGRRVRRAEVAAGDTIGFGPVELVLEAIDAGDAQLAFELPDLPARGPAPAGRGQTTAFAYQPSDDRLPRWLALVRRFLEHLQAAPGGDAGLALAVVTQELSAAGACLVDVAEDGRPQLLSAYGEVDPLRLERVVEVWRARRADSGRQPETFVVEEGATAVFSGGAGGACGLVVLGEIADRRQAAPLLRTLLELFEHLRPRPLAALRASDPPPAESPQLRFPPGYLVGASRAMLAVYAQMATLVAGDLPVLVAGETGVGKELLARTLHLSSARRGGPFVAINCAAIPSELLEAELFGIGDRVATGVAGRRGVFQQAEGGTLFLDEIGEMAGALQAKLLRVLQDKQLRPLGGARIAVDVRIVAATNADYQALIEAGTFRRDLFFRIAGFVLRVPPLRERRDDLPLLIEGFLRRFREETGKPVRGITVRALQALVERDWPGNVRELEHEVRRLVYRCPPQQPIDSAMVMESAPAGTPESAGAEPAASATAPDADGWQQAVRAQPDLELKTLERAAIEEALRRTGGNQVRAARLLGISRHGLRRRMDRFELR